MLRFYGSTTGNNENRGSNNNTDSGNSGHRRRGIKLYPLCVSLRLLPVALLVGAHCSEGHWPSDTECLHRVAEGGFSVYTFKEKPWTLLTHMFIHVSTQHLLTNTFSLLSTLLEFGGAKSLRDNVEESRLTTAVQRTIGSLLVMVGGGAVGGIGGQMLFNWSRVEVRREQAREYATENNKHLMTSSGNSNSNQTSTQMNTSDEGVSRITSWFARTITSARARYLNRVADVQEIINKSMLMCGASAGVCALAGFNATYYGQWATSICLVLPEVFTLLESCEVFHSESPWRSLLLSGGQTVGHAAHIGGFVCGAALGYMIRRVKRSRRSHCP